MKFIRKKEIWVVLQRLRLWMIRKGLIKHKSLQAKLTCLLELTDINLYDTTFRNIQIDFLENNIVTYNNILEYLLLQGLETKFVSVRDITQNSYHYVSFSFWYSDEGEILGDSKELVRFLKNTKAFIVWYEKSAVIKNNTTLLNNVRRLKPYYHNIASVIENIYNGYFKNTTVEL